MEGRYVDDSRTEFTQVIMPPHLNGYGKLFGGQLASWIDILAGTVARRHCGCMVVTAAIDSLRFHESVGQNELLVLKGRVTYVGRTSMEVKVDSFIEDNVGCHRLINTAYVVLVALGCDGRPCPVPPLIPQTEEEKKDFEAGGRRRELRGRIYKALYE